MMSVSVRIRVQDEVFEKTLPQTGSVVTQLNVLAVDWREELSRDDNPHKTLVLSAVEIFASLHRISPDLKRFNLEVPGLFHASMTIEEQ